MPLNLLSSVQDWSTANPYYIGASITFYTVDEDGVREATLATIYANPEGTATALNPQVLDGYGKFQAPVYIQDAVIAEASGPNIPSHYTGVIRSPIEAAQTVI